MNKVFASAFTIILIILIFALSACNGYDTAYFEQIITETKAIESNVCLVKKTVEGDSFSYSKGASGVIYNKIDSSYYILTAFHVVKNMDEDDVLYIQFYDDEGYKSGGLSLYYDSLPTGVIEYGNEKYDLAIVSFTSSRELSTITLASETPVIQNKVAAISNPANRGRNYISFGTVTSKEPVPFGDEMDDIQYNVITHSAYISEGSSGSMLINDKAELIGINLGGSVNGVGKFVEGKAMPIDRVKEFLDICNNL